MNQNSILLVDDEESILETLSFNLSKQGYQVETAHSGEEGIKKFLQLESDLVVTDLMMEGIDGLGVMKEVKRKKPDTMVMVLTGYGSLKTAVEALRLGACDYLQKPCSREELSIRVSNCLSKQKLERQNKKLTEELRIANAKLFEKLTQRKKDHEKLEFYAAELRRSYKELDSFTSIVSHDLQEPLRKLIAFSDRIQEKCAEVLDEQTMDYLTRMQRSAQRMQQLITDLLRYSKVSTREKNFEQVDLKQVIAGVLDDLEIRLSETEGTVELENLPTLEADPLQMRQLFQNLIGNALKFHKKENPPVVQVNSQKGHNGFWEIAVQDNGIGFDEKYLSKIFQPFERLQGRSEYEGSGMGMAICRKIIDRHEGSITASSQPGRGATFIITLPEKQNNKNPASLNTSDHQ